MNGAGACSCPAIHAVADLVLLFVFSPFVRMLCSGRQLLH